MFFPCHSPKLVQALLAAVLAAWPSAGSFLGEFFDEDVTSLMQQPVETLMRQGPKVLAVPLQKQYVPIERNNTVVAYKTAYFGQIQAGGPEPQTFTVVFDTGSGHLILPSTGCTSTTCAKHRRYNRTKSATAIDIEHTGKPILLSAQTRDQLKISFGSGEVLGEFVRDTACLGVGSDKAFCTDMRIVLAGMMTEDPFGLFEFDGVLGLGLGSLALNSHFSLFGQMVEQHPQMDPRFAVFLARDDSGQSAISFGGHDPSWAASDVRWAPVAKPHLGYWQVQIQAVYVGDTLIQECAAGDCHAILDTGTSLLGVPKEVSRGLHRLLARPVPGDHDAPERAATDCRMVPGKPLIFEIVGGARVVMSEEDYSRPQAINMTAPGFKDGWELFCRSLLLQVDMKPPIGPKVFIWGEPVLRKYLTLYDWSRKEIGFATAGTNIPEGSRTTIGAPPEGSLAAGSPLVGGATVPTPEAAAGVAA